MLSAFSTGKALGNQDIARFTGLPRPTVSRLTYTLTELGYLNYLQDQSQYELGPASLELGFAALSTLEVRDVARPYMQEMSERFNVNMALAVPNRLSMISIEVCDGPGLVGLKIFLGSRVPMATTAVGRAYLAAESERRRDIVMSQLQFELGGQWADVRTGIFAAIADIEAKGFCESIGEWNKHINSIATPIVSPDGRGVYGLAAGAPAFLMSREKLAEEVAPHLLATSEAIRRRLHGHTSRAA